MTKNISSNYLGVKFSNTTTSHFSSAKEHFVNAGTAAVDCGTYAAKTAGYAYQIAGSALAGVVAYDFLSGKIMTMHAFGGLMPTVVKAGIATAAGFCYTNPYTALGLTVVGTALLSPEKLYNFGENAVSTVGKAIEGTYENVAGFAHLAAGVVNAAVDVGHAIYENLPSDNADQIILAGALAAPAMLAIEG